VGALDIDVQAKRGVLRGGDMDWEAIEVTPEGVEDVILQESEQIWLAACLRAAFE
jgi:hypothetical protein